MGQQVFVQDSGSATWNVFGDCESAEIPVLIISPTGKKSDAVQTVIDNVPPQYCGLPLAKVRFDDYDSDGNLEMVAVYESGSSSISSKSESEEPEEEPRLSFSCGTSSVHITEAISQVRVHGTKDAGTSIGWNGETGDNFQVSGVDAPFPSCHETYTKKMKISKLTTMYRRKVWACVGKVNGSAFKGWQKGEAMLTSVSFSSPVPENASSPNSEVEITFDFEIRQNESGYKYGGVTLSKEGFEYVWAIRKAKYDDKSKKPVVAVEGVYVSKIVKYADFSVLGI